MKDDIFYVLHSLTFIKTAGAGIRGEHLQPEPAFTGNFCSLLDGVKKLLAIAMARCCR